MQWGMEHAVGMQYAVGVSAKRSTHHLTMREEIGFMTKTCLAWQNSSIFLLSEKNGGENGFMTTYPLSINFKFSLKPEIGCKFMTKRRR